MGGIPYYGRLVTTTEILVAGKVRLTYTKYSESTVKLNKVLKMNNFLQSAISQLSNGTLGAFHNVIVACTVLGKKAKQSKSDFVAQGEKMGVAKSTLLDVWGLGTFFANPDFVRYADVQSAPIGVIESRLNNLGLSKLQHCKEYRTLCNGLESVLFDLQQLNTLSAHADITQAITLLETIKPFKTSLLEWQGVIANVQGVIALHTPKVAKVAEVAEVAEVADFALTRLAILNALTGSELLDIALKMDNDTLAMLQKAIGNELKIRNKKAA